MSANTKTYQPVQAVSVKAAEDLPGFRFVSHLGSVCAAGAKSLGVPEVSWKEDEQAAVITLGTIAVETSESISAGANVTSDSEGMGVVATEGDAVNGRALDSCSEPGFVKILLVP